MTRLLVAAAWLVFIISPFVFADNTGLGTDPFELGGDFTPTDANAINNNVNDNDDRLDTIEAITGIVFSDADGTYTDMSSVSSTELGYIDGLTGSVGTAATRAAEDTMTTGSNLPDGLAIYNYLVANYTAISVGLTTPTDNTWQGKYASGVAGETLTGQYNVLYRKDTGSGTKYYLYNAGTADADNDSYGPVALLLTSGTVVADDAITVTSGSGILADDDMVIASGNVGTPVYAGETDGAITFTKPSDAGDHIIQLGTVANINANGRDVVEFAFTYPDWTVE